MENKTPQQLYNDIVVKITDDFNFKFNCLDRAINIVSLSEKNGESVTPAKYCNNCLAIKKLIADEFIKEQKIFKIVPIKNKLVKL